MEGNYPILMGAQEIGTAKVTRQGLYYRFDCRCQLSGDVVCRLTVTCGASTHNLGILVPEGGAFGLHTKMPVKQLGEGALQFGVRPNHKPVGGRFIPISPEEPFGYLSRLKDAFLEFREGVPGLVISEQESG
ncbi:MAG: hypothetical protein J6Q30_04450 [Oscillospiraceae bacterium]|nr:hypothetical protein [Oscillospiraceae bacterium]